MLQPAVKPLHPPVVSVVMINYNGMPWLESAIASVLATTAVQIELIVVDDGSTDGSRELIERKAKVDATIRPLFLEKNGGISAARNAGIEIAQGMYISLVDSDDLFLPTTIQKQLDAFVRLQQQSPNLVLLTSDAWLVNEAGERRGRYISRDWWDRESAENPPTWTLPSTFFFRRERAARFHAAYRFADAPIFVSRMAALGTIGFTGEPLIEYRLRMVSVTNRNGAQMLREMKATARSQEADCIDTPIAAEDVEPPSWREIAIWVNGRNAKNSVANGKPVSAGWAVAKAIFAQPVKTFSNLVRASQTMGVGSLIRVK